MVSGHSEAEESILACTVQIMQQAIDLLQQKNITAAQFTYESKIMPRSSPGKHFRHVLDHLRLLLDAIETWQTQRPSTQLIVDYDARVMNRIPQLDTSPDVSLREFESMNERVQHVFEHSNGQLHTQPLLLRATTPFLVDMQSTIGRELWFCSLHAIHHYALARVILVQELNLNTVPTQFGVAPSTLVHRQWRRNSSTQSIPHTPRARL